MRWYVRSTGDHDTHLGTLTRGSVVAQCGVRFRSRGVLSGQVAFTNQICALCYPWARGMDEHREWLALATVSGGGVARHGEDCLVNGLSPDALVLLTVAVRSFVRSGMVQVAEPDEYGLAWVSLTEAGLARYQALREQARAHS